MKFIIAMIEAAVFVAVFIPAALAWRSFNRNAQGAMLAESGKLHSQEATRQMDKSRHE